MNITRLSGPSKGRCSAVVHGGLVYAVATDRSVAATVAEQTANALATIETLLNDAGSGKDRLLQTTVYLRDMATKHEMDDVWCDWVGMSENWPQRACVGVDLAGGDLVEIVVTAALNQD